MSFGTALDLTLILALFVLVCTMANLLARITRLERAMRAMVGAPAQAQVAPGPQPVPPELAELTNGSIGSSDPARLIFVSPDCPMCDEAIEMVTAWPESDRRSTYIFYREEPAPDFVAPPAVRVVPHAARLFRSLKVGSTPAFVHVEDGLVHRPDRAPGGTTA